jgi:hypothetical protein
MPLKRGLKAVFPSFHRNLDFVVWKRYLQVLMSGDANLSAGQRVQLEEYQQLPLWIVEGVIARYLFEREVGMDILKGSRVEVVPRGKPARLVEGEFGGQVRHRAGGGAEIVA